MITLITKSIILSLLIIVGFYVYDYNHPKNVYYAKLEKVSSSGEARFRWYDTKLQKVVDPDDQYAWFWAMPKNVPDDHTTTTNWVEYLKKNNDSVFKITGIKVKPDCDYWDKDHCVENIDIKSIEIIK